MNFPYLLNREFTSQHNLTKTYLLHENSLLYISIVDLSTCMKWYRRNIQFQDTHILYDKSINSYFIKFPYKLLGIFELFIFQNSIQSYINTNVIKISIIYKLLKVFQCVTCCGTTAKARCTYINGIGTMVNSSYSTLQILCRS